MIDATPLQSASAFGGFANLGIDSSGNVSIPTGQVIGSFSLLTFFFNIPRKDSRSLGKVICNLTGAATSDGGSHNPGLWKLADDSAWDGVDGDSTFSILVRVWNVSGSFITMRVALNNGSFGSKTTTNPYVINAKAYFFEFLWA